MRVLALLAELGITRSQFAPGVAIGLPDFQILQSAFGTTDGDAVAAFVRLDTDANGALSVDELVQAAHDYYTSGDPKAPGNSLFGPL